MPGACSPYLEKKKKKIPIKISDRVLFNETHTGHSDFLCNAKDKELHTVISEFYLDLFFSKLLLQMLWYTINCI